MKKYSTNDKLNVLKNFVFLCKYIEKEKKNKNINEYLKDFSAFLLHANHTKAYDFVAPFCKDKKILDIGCFLGYGEKRISSHAKEVIAIDTNEKALNAARQNNRSISNIKFQKTDAKDLPFYNKTFDIIIAFQLIEHIPPKEVDCFLQETKRVLKDTGTLFIVTPNRKFRLMPFQKPTNPEHYQEFTAKKLAKTLKSVFGKIEIKGVRAKEWIEDIEKKRVRKSFHQAYIFRPLLKLLNTNFLKELKKILKKIRSKIKTFQTKRNKEDINTQFNDLLNKFSMNDFYLEKRKNFIDKSIDIFAICKK